MVTTIQWCGDRVRYLDQQCLPLAEVYRETDRYTDIADAIRRLSIRGAPLIGVAAAYGVALAVLHAGRDGMTEREALGRSSAILLATRPTAVNLAWALNRVALACRNFSGDGGLATRCLAIAREIHDEDIRMCRAIGDAGAPLIPAGARILTHCNAGALATGGSGTALAVIAAAHREGKVRAVFASETRPAFQGARLTAWELQKAGIQVTVVTDSTAAFLMQKGEIDLVIVGADRIASNGDTANKIGTFSHAVAARVHKLPFYIAAPGSTVDGSIADGSAIPIEERAAEELTVLNGTRIAPPGIGVYAPAFDVTPASFISAIITDRGIVRPPYNFAGGVRG
ncbi:MAG TPA: S-methyl-5-thioribose-1-phosphate isomerase [Bacteroidota bacterium]|nr:S-methyl-5-thioribose-1-phosphate isomerase [Bacteroidota bacterium]